MIRFGRRSAVSGQSLKLDDVKCENPGFELEGISGGVKDVREEVVEFVEDAGEVAASFGFGLVAPKHVGEACARDGVAPHGKVTEEGEGFARRERAERHCGCGKGVAHLGGYSLPE
jgi:hypothetical protein